MSPVNDSFMSGSLDHSVRIWDLRVNACQGILRLRGRPTVAYDQQGLVFAVAMEGGAIKLFDSRSYDKGPFDTFLVGGDMAEVCDIKFSNDGKSMLLTTTSNNVYVLDAYGGEKRCAFSLDPSPNTTIEATFTPDGQYVLSEYMMLNEFNLWIHFACLCMASMSICYHISGTAYELCSFST
ncbi:Protein ANTHESIS POMOTING FACTOR 1 [Sarracenia purpurea var. burkii]